MSHEFLGDVDWSLTVQMLNSFHSHVLLCNEPIIKLKVAKLNDDLVWRVAIPDQVFRNWDAKWTKACLETSSQIALRYPDLMSVFDGLKDSQVVG